MATGICGTDVHIAAWTPGYESMERAMPVTLGHELSGIIAAVGPDLPGDLIGRRVTVRPPVVCHECAACLAGADGEERGPPAARADSCRSPQRSSR